MSKAKYILFYIVNIAWNYSQFKFIKYENTWKIFKRFGNDQCLYYEEVHNEDSFLFPTTNNKYLYLAYNKVLINEEEWKIPNCPEINTTSIKYKNMQFLERGQWYKGSDVSRPVYNVEDHDIESCIEYGNLSFQISSYSEIQQTNSNNCLDLILQSIEPVNGDKFLFILYGFNCGYGYLDSIKLGKCLNRTKSNRFLK